MGIITPYPQDSEKMPKLHRCHAKIFYKILQSTIFRIKNVIIAVTFIEVFTHYPSQEYFPDPPLQSYKSTP